MRLSHHLLASQKWLFAAMLVLAVFGASAVRAMEVERVVSPGGIEAWLVEDHRNPIIAVELAFRGGATHDPVDKMGLSNFVASTLDEGAGPYDSQAFQGRLEDLSVRLRFSDGYDIFRGSMMTLREHHEAAFELLGLALTQPRFDEEAVERLRRQLLAQLKREEDDSNLQASRALRRIIFGDHPYGRPANGTIESLAGIEIADLKAYPAARFGLDRLKIGVVGDISADELKALLDRTFLALPGTAPLAAVSDVMPVGGGDLVVIEKATPQSIVALAQPGLKRKDPDFYAAFVANHIFGGGSFSSRLYDEVREKRGLAYSVYSYLSPLDHSAVLYAGVGTANERVAESLSVIREEWRRFAEEGPSAEELDLAKTFLTGSYPLRFSSSDNIAGMLVDIQIEDLGIDHIVRRNEFIEAVTLEDVRRVAAELFAADDLAIVIVGQPRDVKPNRPAPNGAS